MRISEGEADIDDRIVPGPGYAGRMPERDDLRDVGEGDFPDRRRGFEQKPAPPKAFACRLTGQAKKSSGLVLLLVASCRLTDETKKVSKLNG